tara:strand:- start:1651 stop:2421 length:771 start_codon:yes stop_codon:yes gene_type:complete
MKKLFIAVGLLLSLAACASGSYVMPATPQQAASIKTIGIVSVIGQRVTYMNMGWMKGTREESSGDTENWGFDQFALEKLTAKLSPRYKIVPIEIDRTKSTGTEKSVSEALRATLKPGQPPVDAYLVLYPTYSADYISDSGAALNGLGVYRRKGSSIQVFAACDLALLDAKTFATLGGGQLGTSEVKITTADYLSGQALSKSTRNGELAHRKINAKLAVANSWDEFTPEQLEQVKAGITSLLNDSLDYPLKGMGLVQ